MDTSKLKKFAQYARRSLIEQVESKLKLVLNAESEARRESPRVVAALENRLAEQGQEQLIEQVAYTWFNRFCALRFMDINQYNRIMVISPIEGQFQPEILTEAKAGHIDENTGSESAREKIFALLDGSLASRDGQSEAFRLLIVAVCNDLHDVMPYMFERINDYTELLMPDDLLSGNSILAYTREAMTPEVCESVESIGWLYQFYISEKKDEVFAGLKKNQKITAENIPAATQLFTPHWIVRYLVENSLGRLWLLNRPDSKLAERMDYYIAPEEPETDFLKIGKPEEIKICDPACGSGHMLTYAFDLLHSIYGEEGYDAAQIPELILAHNLTGVEIDDRAGALAAFALAMKAADKLGRRRFLRMEAKPNICVLQNVAFKDTEIEDVVSVVGKDLFTDEFRETLGQFEQAKNFGSLIVPKLHYPAEALRTVEARDFAGDLLLSPVLGRVVTVLRMAEVLSPKYHVVVANPPYAGAKGLNKLLAAWIKDNYSKSKSDLMTCFMERSSDLTLRSGFWGMINLPSWMFLGSFQKCRIWLLEQNKIDTLLQLGRGIFGSDFGSVAFTINKRMPKGNDAGNYRRLFEHHVQVRTPDEINTLFLNSDYNRFNFPQSDFDKIPGSPIAYWIVDNARAAYKTGDNIGQTCYGQPGLQTSDNNTFIRLWMEVDQKNTGLNFQNSELASRSGHKWFPYLKGGDFRKWHGNHEYVVNWLQDGRAIKEYVSQKYPYLNGNIDYVVKDRGYYFKELVSYTKITAAKFNARTSPAGFLFDVAGSSVFPADGDRYSVLGFFNSKVCELFLRAQNPTVNIQSGDIDNLPYVGKWLKDKSQDISVAIEKAVGLAKSDWDAYETSWDFTVLPLLQPDHRAETLEDSYAAIRAHWQGMTVEMQRLEQENNRIFIDAYGLQDELTPEVPLD